MGFHSFKMFRVEIVLFVLTFICLTDVHSSCEVYGIYIEANLKTIIDLSHDKLDQYCHGKGDNDNIQQMLPGCETLENKMFQGYEDSLNYLCVETLDEFKHHQSCLAKSNVVNRLEECDGEASKDLKGIGLKQRLCGIVMKDYSCIRSVVEAGCGKEAADWMVTYTKKVLTPVLNDVGCTVMPDWAFSFFGLGAAIVLIAVSIKGCMICAKKRKKARMEAANNFGNVLAAEKPEASGYDDKVI